MTGGGACLEHGVTFRYKDYCAAGRARYKRMTLATDEFIRRFLMSWTRLKETGTEYIIGCQ